MANHTHGYCAADRSAAVGFAHAAGVKLGRKPYFLQMSIRDQRDGQRGCRGYYWAKDVIARHQDDRLERDDILVLIDVDFHARMPDVLSRNKLGLPLLIYTFQPTSVGCSTGDYSFTFTTGNKVKYTVAGGPTSFEHQVWDYGTDCLIAVKRNCCSVVKRVIIYLVDRVQVDDHHQIVMLTPIGRWDWPVATFALQLEGKVLQRLTPVDGNFSRLYLSTTRGLYVNTGLPGAYLTSTTEAHNDDACRNLAVINQHTKLTPSQVMSLTGGDKASSTVGTLFHRSLKVMQPPFVAGLPYGSGVYSMSDTGDHGDEQPVVLPFMAPIVVGGAFVPRASVENLAHGIHTRLLQYSDRKEEPLSKKLAMYIVEFKDLLVPEQLRGKGIPNDLDDLYGRSTPSQRTIHEASECMDEKAEGKAHIKRESYDSAKALRTVISTDPATKRGYAGYTHAFSEGVMGEHHVHWYAFNRSGRKVAKAWAKMCSEAVSHIVLTDLKHMEGHMGKVLRALEEACMMAYFGREYHSDMLGKMRKQHHMRVKVALADVMLEFMLLYQRASGGFDTALFNSIGNGFIAYVGHRETGLVPATAWKKLGLYGGDDGGTPDIDIKDYKRAAILCGQKLTAVAIARGSSGCKFLARYYGPEVWFGDENSCTDIARALRKIHLAPPLPESVTAQQKLYERCLGYSYTDAQTPFLGAFCSRVLTLTSTRAIPKYKRELQSWWAQYPSDEQFPNKEADWMWDLVDTDLPGFDAERFKRDVASASTVGQLLTLRHYCELPQPTIAYSVVIDGEFHEPAPAGDGRLPDDSKSVSNLSQRVQTATHRPNAIEPVNTAVEVRAAPTAPAIVAGAGGARGPAKLSPAERKARAKAKKQRSQQRKRAAKQPTAGPAAPAVAAPSAPPSDVGPADSFSKPQNNSTPDESKGRLAESGATSAPATPSVAALVAKFTHKPKGKKPERAAKQGEAGREPRTVVPEPAQGVWAAADSSRPLSKILGRGDGKVGDQKSTGPVAGAS
jgi:hypothetical protein